jgi:hypothetical protein
MIGEPGSEIEAMVAEHTQVRPDSLEHRDFMSYLVSTVAALAGSERLIAYADNLLGGSTSPLDGVDALFATDSRVVKIRVRHRSVEAAVAPISALRGVEVHTGTLQDIPTFESCGDVLLTIHLPKPLWHDDDSPDGRWRWRMGPDMTRGEWQWRLALPWLMALRH